MTSSARWTPLPSMPWSSSCSRSRLASAPRSTSRPRWRRAPGTCSRLDRSPPEPPSLHEDPMTVEPVARAESAPAHTTQDPGIAGAPPDFPVEFADPSHAKLTWEWDDMHMPFALSPLSGDWAVMIGSSFDSWKVDLEGDFPSRSYAVVWNGYSYFGFSPNAEGAEREANRTASYALWRSRIEP